MKEKMGARGETRLEGVIHRLPGDVVGRIAAGEMIVRPAAAVKELIENALDAHATRIAIRIAEALDRELEISDNGCGIGKDDLSMALERYTTSKIEHEEDLLAIETLGFRGEALAAIAEVSRVTLLSRTEDSEHAWQIRAEAGKLGPLEVAARAPGTTVTVADLFFNTPVRKRFLKKGPTEIRLARESVQAYAQAYPGVGWHLKQDGRVLLDLPPATDLRGRLLRMHGSRLVEGLLAVDGKEGAQFGLRGFVGVPELARAGSRHQTFFVNGRWVAAPWLGQAVRQAFGDLIPNHQSPWAVLFLTLPPDQVDVNLHPTKREVRFLDERGVFGFVQRTVRPVVARLLPRFFLERKGEERATEGDPAASTGPATTSGPGLRGGSAGAVRTRTGFDGIEEARRLYGTRESDAQAEIGLPAGVPRVQDALTTSAGEALTEESARDLVSLWQLHGRYVLAQTRKGLFIIDQHAAHERVLYEKILTRMNRESSGAQQLLFPVILELDEEEIELYRELAGGLTRMGFDCEEFEERSLVVRGVPPLWRARSEGELVRDLLDEAKSTGLREGETAQGLARAFACRAAIKAGEPLSVEEMNRLMDELFSTRVPHGDPHGRPTFVFISLADLDRRFGRGGG